MENTDINRQIYFAQHLNQTVLFGANVDSILVLNTTTLNDYHDGDILELTPLSSITDEDAVEIVKLQQNILRIKEVDISFYYEDPELSVCLYSRMNDTYEVVNYHTYQYLQSKGYALPFMGLSIETIIEYGWLKLKQ